MKPHPSTPAAEARDSLDAVDAIRDLNAERLRRPRRYWVMVGAMLALFGFIPAASELVPPLAAVLTFPVLVIAIAVVASRKQPSAVRHLRLRGVMWLPYIGGVLFVAVIAGSGAALFESRGWWGIPVATALVLFLVGAVGGPALDAVWARRARSRD